jgi:dTMP kinase
VLCDRFTDSTVVYQGAGRGLEAGLLAQLDALATGGRRPDLAIVIDVDVETAQRRRERGARGPDRLDEETLEFQRRVRAAYLELAAREPGRVRVVDGSGEFAATAAAVRELLVAVGVGRRR